MTTSGVRADAFEILRRVVSERDPARRVANVLRLRDEHLQITGLDRTIPRNGRIIVLAVGKASVPMATGALQALDGAVDQALAVTKSGMYGEDEALFSDRLEVLTADHPVPGTSSLEAGQRILESCESLTERDLVIMLISGGGSALVEALVEGVSLSDLQRATESMLHRGATINQLNVVRRRLSQIKGGGLARAMRQASVVNLIISDVLRNPLHDIASGPTVSPVDDRSELSSVLRSEALMNGLPDSVRRRIERDTGQLPPPTDNVIGTLILDDAELAARDAANAAEALGYNPQTIGFDFQGEACEFGRFLGTLGRHVVENPSSFQRPVAFVGAGELTVTVRGDGIGGRNTEMALAAAHELEGTERIAVVSFATDGDDGSSGFAGGIVDGSTVSLARKQGMDSRLSLQQNDSATVLRTTDCAIDFGNTGTNVNDLYLLLAESGARRSD